MTEAVKLLEYRKKNERYWDRAKLHRQVVEKTLPIADAFFPGYSLRFLFDNATGHSVNVEYAQCIQNMNKEIKRKQTQL